MKMFITKCFTVLILVFALSSSVKKKPSVLIIGDSISIGYTPFVQNSLEDKAVVWHNPGNAKFTGNGLNKIDEWIDQGNWDVIQINWGLWDLCYRQPSTNDLGKRDKENGVITTEISKYTTNLEQLIKRIKKKSDAKIIFVTTTYVPETEAGRFEEDVKRYNNVAKGIMLKHNIVINDIYEKSIPIHHKYAKAIDDVHYVQKGYVELSKLITNFLEQELQTL
ncbi:SGNH/GDSL hydrolase family protein [Formosa undariae]|uniref:SGNH/GDSL hydrolase family protein n=1 Tax=Formosa undariae TaxID=1325436 RepID=A0ABV5EZZ0_9FLAO